MTNIYIYYFPKVQVTLGGYWVQSKPLVGVFIVTLLFQQQTFPALKEFQIQLCNFLLLIGGAIYVVISYVFLVYSYIAEDHRTTHAVFLCVCLYFTKVVI